MKLFDFGLARKLEDTMRANGDQHDAAPLYTLTPQAGSLRFMAPEVATNKPYVSFLSSRSKFQPYFLEIFNLTT